MSVKWLFLLAPFFSFPQNGDMLTASIQQALPTDHPDLIIKLGPDGVSGSEDDPITTWTDALGFANATAGTAPQLHIEGGVNQVEFVAANLDWLSIADASFDPTPGTDEFTIIVKIGHAFTDAAFQYIIGKAQLSTASRQIGIYTESSLNRFAVGGTVITTGNFGYDPGDVICLIVRTTGADAYVNATKIVDNAAIGTSTTTNNTIIGARWDGSSGSLNGSLEWILIYNDALTEAEYLAERAKIQ